MALALLTEEERWWRAHPNPETNVSGDTLTLWNYPVARSELANPHRAAVDNFLQIEGLAEPMTVELKVRGHASPTGENTANRNLALARAQAVEKYLQSLGAQSKNIHATSAGSSEPLDGDRSGFGLARDRRVVIVKLTPPPPKNEGGALLPDDLPPQSPGPPPIIKGVKVEGSFGTRPVIIAHSQVVIAVSLSGTFKASAQDPGGGVILGAALKNGKFSGKVEGELIAGVAGKFTIKPPSAAGPPTIEAGAKFEGVIGTPEVGVQNPPKEAPVCFGYIKFTIGEVPLLADPRDPTSKITFKGEVKFDVGPGPGMIKNLAELEVWLGGTAAAEGFTAAELTAAGIGGGGIVGATAAVGGAIAIFVVINGVVIYAVHQAKVEADAYCAILARRDGKAARVAWAIVGDAGAKHFLDRETQWTRAVASVQMLEAFRQGRKDVEQFLRETETRDTKVAAWRAKYDAAGTMNSAHIRQRVYEDVGGIERDPAAGASL